MAFITMADELARSGFQGAAAHGAGLLASGAASYYPTATATAWHAAHHIPGLTGRWMDYGTLFGGAVRGGFHRLQHGHHLVEDGLRVLVHPKLKYGEFLHHLGMDVLTRRGIPNPLIPTGVARWLTDAGFSKAFTYEMMTVNLQKLLGGGLALLCSGNSVYACFSDTIPHTFSAAGLHFLYGSLDLIFGIWPFTNPLMLVAGAGEMAVSAVTAARTIWDTHFASVLPVVNMSADLFFPLLGGAALFGGLFGAATGYLFDRDVKMALSNGIISASASAAAVTVGAAAAGTACAAFLGPMAGIATSLLLRKAFSAKNAKKRSKTKSGYNPDDWQFSLRRPKPIPTAPIGPNPTAPVQACPVLTIPQKPIGEIQGERLLLY